MSRRTPIPSRDLAELVDDLLPQTQCRQCGYDGCRPYARAMVDEGVAINKCPPGGQATISALAILLGCDNVGLDPAHGIEKPAPVAVIREPECIGCTKCIQVCPVDAIVGAAKLMHTVIEAECTGCELCIEPCPVDCIDLLVPSAAFQPADSGLRHHRRARYDLRSTRLAKEAETQTTRPHSIATPQTNLADRPVAEDFSREQARAEIERAVARVKARRQAARDSE